MNNHKRGRLSSLLVLVLLWVENVPCAVLNPVCYEIRVFGWNQIKMRSSWSRMGPNPETGVLTGRGEGVHTDMLGRCRGTTDRDWDEESTRQ